MPRPIRPSESRRERPNSGAPISPSSSAASPSSPCSTARSLCCRFTRGRKRSRGVPRLGSIQQLVFFLRPRVSHRVATRGAQHHEHWQAPAQERRFTHCGDDGLHVGLFIGRSMSIGIALTAAFRIFPGRVSDHTPLSKGDHPHHMSVHPGVRTVRLPSAPSIRIPPEGGTTLCCCDTAVNVFDVRVGSFYTRATATPFIPNDLRASNHCE